MDAITAIGVRHSTRVYTDTPVPRDVIETIAGAGHRAASAYNEQPWHFVVVTDAPTRQQIADLTDHGKFIAQAPACIAVFCKDTKYFLEAGSAATQNILVAAAALGVDSCWVAGDKKPYDKAVGSLLGVPADLKLISLIPLGYALTPGQPTARRPLAEILHWDQF